jgi:DNA-3-methyladenine glycosylase
MSSVTPVADGLTGAAPEVAPLLLGAVVTSDIGPRVAVRVVEVEAYGASDDPASHAYRGRTRRNASMFGRPGIAYLYAIYGMHVCLNVVVGPEGEAAAVLVRAAEVTDGVDLARHRRVAPSGRVPSDRDLARGPARLAQALAATTAHDGLSMLDPDGPLTLTLPSRRSDRYLSGPRVGISRATERPWRFWLPDEPAVSAYRGGGRARRGRRAQA